MRFFTKQLLTVPDWPLTIEGQIRAPYTVLLTSRRWQENLRVSDVDDDSSLRILFRKNLATLDLEQKFPLPERVVIHRLQSNVPSHLSDINSKLDSPG